MANLLIMGFHIPVTVVVVVVVVLMQDKSKPFSYINNFFPVFFRLVRCQITKKTCKGLASIRESNHSCLKDLDLSCNDLRDSGVKNLSQWLTHRNCKLERLRLVLCI